MNKPIKTSTFKNFLVVTLLSLSTWFSNTVVQAQETSAIWIDTDPSVETGGREVDDGFALIQAFNSPELDIRGISTVFGNAPLKKAHGIALEITELFGPPGLEVFRGAANADELGTETTASRALANILRTQRLTVLALGPVTNIATVLRNHPELGKNINAIVAVAGRRPGQQFLTRADGLPHRDFNFELDVNSFQILLESAIASEVPLILTPWEISSKVWITKADIEHFQQSSPAGEWLYQPAMDWIERWEKRYGKSAFNPYDSLAVGYVTSRELLTCEELKGSIQILPNDRLAFAPTESAKKPYLIASKEGDSLPQVLYCFKPSGAFTDDLIQRLLKR